MRSAMYSAMLAALLFVTACDAPTAARPGFAYNPTTLSNGQIYRFKNGRTLRVWADVGDSTRAVNLGTAVRRAIVRWNSVPAFAEYELVLVTDPASAQILVFDRGRPLPIRPGSCVFDPRGSIGYTYFCVDGARANRLALASGAASEASVVIRVDESLVVGQNAYDAIVAHEFGHAVGIGAHSSVATDLMFGLPATPLPTGRDAQTLQYVLGSRADIIL